MKNTLLILFLSSFVSTISAQTAHLNAEQTLQEHESIVNYFLGLNESRNVAKTTANPKRLSSKSSYGFDGSVPQFADTTVYQYSHGRGSYFDFNVMAYKECLPLYDDPTFVYTQFEKITVNADSGKTYRIRNGALSLTLFHNSTFSAMHELTSQQQMFNDFSNWHYDKQFTLSYNAQGRLSAYASLELDTLTGKWDIVRLRKINYSAAGKIKSDTVFYNFNGTYFPSQVHFWKYNSAGKPTEITVSIILSDQTWTDSRLISLQYYPSGNLKSLADYVYGPPGNKLPYAKDSFIYSSNMPYYTERYILYGNYTQFKPVGRFSKSVNNMGLPDTLFYHKIDSTGNLNFYSKVSFEYNTDKLPTRSYIQSNSTGNLEFNKLTNYYYETYQPTGVKEIASVSNISMLLFPNPAHDALNIIWDEGVGKRVSIFVTTLDGRTVFSESVLWAKTKHEISIKDLPTGVYVLYVHDSKGIVIFSQRLLKN